MRLLHLYVQRFNQRDWDGLRELIAPTPGCAWRTVSSGG
jgi:hypothetical protein